jgi:hypothetical protein
VGYRWLDVYCGGYRQVKPVDLAAAIIEVAVAENKSTGA